VMPSFLAASLLLPRTDSRVFRMVERSISSRLRSSGASGGTAVASSSRKSGMSPSRR
jgi:hypothetical protein